MEKTVTWIVAILFSLIGWGSLLHFSWIARNWPETRGRVVGNVEEYSKGTTVGHSSRRVVNFAMVEFSASGRMYRVRGGVGRSKPWPLGETIALRYKPENPEHMLDLNFWQRLLFSGAFIFFGAMCWAVILGVVG